MGGYVLVVITGPVSTALETNPFVFAVQTRFDGKRFAIIQAGTDDDVKYLRSISSIRAR